ncbi:DUF5666 domain-containing protein [Piscinibacter sp.]|uniref:DUF5666 domain-containing protein n=1 Tax=Piscinibacter sp. TaxID=1903157 RepID=UPI003559509E
MFTKSLRWFGVGGGGAVLAALAGAVLVVGCGGGGSSAPTVTASSYTAGPISGFGSVIVNGVRFDDSAATVEDEEGVAQASSELKLGAMVEVDASDVRNFAARALRFRFSTDIVGPVNSVDAAASTLVVLGQVVDVTPTTVFADDLPGGLAGLTAGTVVGVHAHFDAANGHYIATRIDARPNAPVYRLRGLVSHLDTTAKTFQIGGEVISYAGIADADLPNDFADGLRVRVRLQKTQVNGQWIALTVRHGVRRIDDMPQAHLRGIISSFTSTTQFAVNGIDVDASNASFPDGTDGIVLGAPVEVEGRVQNGVIIARVVEIDDDRKVDLHRFELHGAISGLDTGAKTFMLRGVKVNYNAAVAFVNGTADDLANDRTVEVLGVLAVDRQVLVAVIIKFEN